MSAYRRDRSLHRLIYASQQNVKPHQLEEEVGKIISTSLLNNQKVGVTGLLLVHDGWFVQALEGPYVAVMTTYGRIVDDPRHTEPTVISAGPAESREFGEWKMCARQISAADDAILATLSQKGEFDPTALTPAAVLRLLKAVRDIQTRSTPTITL